MLAIGPKNIKIFFIHIPRTAGRYINSLLYSSGFDLYYDDYSDQSIDEIVLPHLHYPHYKKILNDDTIPEFTVVRDPLDKFNSAITPIIQHNYPNLNINAFSKNELLEFLDFLKNQGFKHINWFRHQSEFISEKTLVWKYEDKFNWQFKNWMYNNFNIEIKKIREDKNFNKRTALYDNLKKIYIDDDKKETIKLYYEKDYKQFYS